MVLASFLGATPLVAEVFLEVPVSQTSSATICPGSSRLVIPFRTGGGITHVTRIVFPKVARPAVGGWNSPQVFCGISTIAEGDLRERSQRFRYKQPAEGSTPADIVFDRPFWRYIAEFDQPGGAGLAANTDYFLVLDFSVDVSAGVQSGWCLPAGAQAQAVGSYGLTAAPEAAVPSVVIEGVIHQPPPQQVAAPLAAGAEPVVAGVAWMQRGEGTEWAGAGTTAAIAVAGTVPYGGAGFPDSPPRWRGLEARVEGPGIFSYDFSGPLLARGGREPDFARCSLWLDGVRIEPALGKGSFTHSLGPGSHQLLWMPEMGERAFHLQFNDFTGTFTLSNLRFGPAISLEEALDDGETAWTAAGVWTALAGEPPRDWAAADFSFAEATVPCFRATVTGPGLLNLESRLLVTYTDLQLWTHVLRDDSDSRWQLSIDGQPVAERARGKHQLALPPGVHSLELSLSTRFPSGMYPSSTGQFRAEIESLQFIPGQPASSQLATFDDWRRLYDWPPTMPGTADPDGNGLSGWMEWAAGLAPGSQTPLITIEHVGGELILKAPRNWAAPIRWRVEEKQSVLIWPSGVFIGPWIDVTSTFTQEVAFDTHWQGRRPLPNFPNAVYRLSWVPE
jgi:hypothetical protein